MNTTKPLLVIGLALLIVSCQHKSKDELEIKKDELTKYKKEHADLESKIKALEREISQADPNFAKTLNSYTLVSTVPVQKKKFVHKIDVRGVVESRKNILVSSEAMGQITSIKVKEGDKVKKGDVMMIIDAQVLKNTIEELKTSLDLAKIVYERQSNLWKNNIGTEIQYLQAKNNYQSLQRKLETAQLQLEKATLRAPFSGNIDHVMVKEGEMAQIGLPMVRIVSLNDMYIKADVSENYIGLFNEGDAVDVDLPSLNKKFTSTISAVGDVIDANNRTYSIEVKLVDPENITKPNLTALISLIDYLNPNAVVIPTEIIQQDNIGDYVYVLQKNDSVTIANKVHIKRGKSFQSESEIEEGLSQGEKVISKGFREVTDGLLVSEVKEN